MRISNLVVLLLLVGLLAAGIYGTLNDLAASNAYDVSYDSKYETSFNQIENVTSDLNESYHEIVDDWSGSKGATIGIVTFVVDAIGLAIDVVILPFQLISIIVFDVIEFIGMPDWAITFIIGIIIAGIVFGLISLALRYKET